MTMQEWEAMCWQFPEDRFRKMVQSIYSGLTVGGYEESESDTEEMVA